MRLLPLTQVSQRRLGTFDSILMLGNNLGLVGNPRRARWLLRRFHRMTTDAARIIAGTRDPYRTDVPEHLAYHVRNRARGRMPGQARIRVRYRRYAGPWIDLLMLSPKELGSLLQGSGWAATRFIGVEKGPYVAILEKDGSHST